MKRTWLLLISLFNLCILVAQPTYHIKHYSVNDGMSQGIVQTIIQDKKGFLWFGTWNGLNNSTDIHSKTIRHLTKTAIF